MGTIAIDSFNDTGGTLLTAHTACTSGTHTAGLTWARTGYSDVGTLQIRSTQGVRNTAKSQNIINYASPTPGNADQTVDVEFTLPTNHNYAPGDIVNGWCRGLVGATQTRYAAQWVGNNSGGFLTFTLRKVVGGTNTNLFSGSWTFSSFPTTAWMRISAVGTTIRLFMDGVSQARLVAGTANMDSGAVTDSAISAAGNVGIQEELGSPSTASDADAPYIVYFESSDTSTGALSGASPGSAGARGTDAGSKGGTGASPARAGAEATGAGTKASSGASLASAGVRGTVAGTKSVSAAAGTSSGGARSTDAGAKQASAFATAGAGAESTVAATRAASGAVTGSDGAEATTQGARATSGTAQGSAGITARTAGSGAAGVTGAVVGSIGATGQCSGAKGATGALQGRAGATGAKAGSKSATGATQGLAGALGATSGQRQAVGVVVASAGCTAIAAGLTSRSGSTQGSAGARSQTAGTAFAFAARDWLWRTGQPESRWTVGQPAGRWRTRSPDGRWAAGVPRQ